MGGSCSNQTGKIRLVSDLEGAEGHAKDFGFYPLSGKKKVTVRSSSRWHEKNNWWYVG